MVWKRVDLREGKRVAARSPNGGLRHASLSLSVAFLPTIDQPLDNQSTRARGLQAPHQRGELHRRCCAWPAACWVRDGTCPLQGAVWTSPGARATFRQEEAGPLTDKPWGAGRTLEIPDMMMVLFFRGDLTFSFEDSLSWRMATSATGSEPFSTSSSAGGKAAVGTLCTPLTVLGTPRAGGNDPQAGAGKSLLERARE